MESAPFFKMAANGHIGFLCLFQASTVLKFRNNKKYHCQMTQTFLFHFCYSFVDIKKSRWPPNANFRYLVSMLKQLISYYNTNVSFGKNVPKDHAYIKICSNLRIKFQNSRWLPAAILDALYTSIYSGWFCVQIIFQSNVPFFDMLCQIYHSRKRYTTKKVVFVIQNGHRRPFWKTCQVCSLRTLCCKLY